jgi:hypothetical protein
MWRSRFTHPLIIEGVFLASGPEGFFSHIVSFPFLLKWRLSRPQNQTENKLKLYFKNLAPWLKPTLLWGNFVRHFMPNKNIHYSVTSNFSQPYSSLYQVFIAPPYKARLVERQSVGGP